MVREKILVIDDEPDVGRLISKILSEEGYQLLVSLDGEEGISKIKTEQPDFDRIVGNSPQLKSEKNISYGCETINRLFLARQCSRVKERHRKCGSFCG